MRLDSLCTYIAKNLEFLDTSVHIQVHVVTMQIKKTSVKAKTHHSEKFAPRENNLLYDN